MVHLHRRRGGVEGTYRCEIPDAKNVTQTIYIGVYNTIGKSFPTHWYILKRFDDVIMWSVTYFTQVVNSFFTYSLRNI